MMDVTEQLEWLKDNMPDGWALVLNPGESYAMVQPGNDSEDGQWVNPNGGDIGLAPLTALLKQAVSGHPDNPEASKYVCSRLERDGWHFAHDWTTPIEGVEGGWRETGCGGSGDTEFEAVFEAYREMKK